MATTGSVAASARSRSHILISCFLHLPFFPLSLQLDLLEDLSILLVFLKSCFLALSVLLFFYLLINFCFYLYFFPFSLILLNIFPNFLSCMLIHFFLD